MNLWPSSFYLPNQLCFWETEIFMKIFVSKEWTGLWKLYKIQNPKFGMYDHLYAIVIEMKLWETFREILVVLKDYEQLQTRDYEKILFEEMNWSPDCLVKHSCLLEWTKMKHVFIHFIVVWLSVVQMFWRLGVTVLKICFETYMMIIDVSSLFWKTIN